MAGSLKNFVYTDDLGQDFVVNRDESNIEAVNGNGYGYTGTPVIRYGLPRNITPRYARYRYLTQQIKVELMEDTVDPPAVIFTNFQLAEVVKERRKSFLSFDTGLTDGDQP